MQTLHRKHPEQRFGTGLCTRGNSKTIYNQNLGVEKLVKICAIWILTTVILIIVSWVFCSKFTNLSERQSTLLPKHKFMPDLVTLHISCSAGRCVERARNHVASTWGAPALIRHLRGLL